MLNRLDSSILKYFFIMSLYIIIVLQLIALTEGWQIILCKLKENVYRWNVENMNNDQTILNKTSKNLINSVLT